jgi:hypothetical protein
MFQKTLVIIGVSALACGLSVQSASAKARHHVRHHAAKVAKAEPMKATPGNNPFPIVASNETNRSKYQAPTPLSGNNPMTIRK